MDSAQIKQMAEDIDTAISVMVNSILANHGVGGVDAASICIAVAGMQQGRVDTLTGDPEVLALFETFRKHGADRFAALKRRNMN
jgi:hypothetical protein